MVSVALSTIAIAALAASTASAHGVINKPGLKFTGTAYGGDFSALVPMTALKPVGGNKFTHYPDATLNANAFGDAFRASEYKTLKDFILKNQDLSKGRFKNPKTPECGFTDPTSGPVQALPDEIEWYGGQMNHPGPCEVWCDDEIVLPFTHNCQATYPQGKFKYDKAKCVGKNRLTFYWMSTLLEWQVYIDCAKIGNGSPTSTSKPTTPTVTTTKPSGGAAPTTKPAAPTTKPAAPTTKPAATTAKPPATTPKTTSAPANPKPVPTSKCKVRRS